MDTRLARIRELIDQKEAIDTELASLIGGMPEAPRRGRPRKPDANSSGAVSMEQPGGDTADA